MTRAPELTWLPGDVPRSQHFDDIYFDPEHGIAESQFNFLDGVGIPAIWRGRRRFVIGETGFGTGLNFLLTQKAWREHRPAGGWLHYISCEAYPLSSDQLERAHRQLPADFSVAAQQLRERFPRSRIGFRRVWLDSDRIALTLLFGDAAKMLSQLEARVDAWFLDGFAPRRNPAMWSDAVLDQVARTSAAAAQLATFTAAGTVRRGLASRGFEVRREAGFGRKRERLTASLKTPPDGWTTPRWAALPEPGLGPIRIHGAGVGGQSVAAALDRRGLEHQTVDEASARASDVPRALVMPRLSVDESIPGRFFSAAFAYARQHFCDLGVFTPSGVSEPVEAEGMDRATRVASRWPEAQWQPERSALFYPDAGYVSTAELRSPPTASLNTRELCGERWRDVFATGPAMTRHPALPVRNWRGQVTLFRSSSTPPPFVIATSGYVVPPDAAGRWQVGATFDAIQSGTTAATPRDDERNLALAARLWPSLANNATFESSWAGVRAALPDRLPAAGPLPDVRQFSAAYAIARGPGYLNYSPDDQTQWTLAGLGARGFTSAALAAELLVSQMTGDPWPIERELALAIHPARFVFRALKRGQPASQ